VDDVFLSIHLIPGSRKNQIIGYTADGKLKVKVTAPALEGKANQALLKYLSKILLAPISGLYIKQGEKSHHKVIGIRNITSEAINQLLLRQINQNQG